MQSTAYHQDNTRSKHSEQHTNHQLDQPPRLKTINFTQDDSIQVNDQLCSQDFEADISKAIQLSLAEEERTQVFDNPLKQQRLDSDECLQQHVEHQPQHQCPVCEDFLELSDMDFEQHVNLCLDKNTSYTNTDQVQSWQQLFQSIPTAIHRSFVNKATTSISTSITATTTITTATSMTKTFVNEETKYIPLSSVKTSKVTSPSDKIQQPQQIPSYKWMKDTKFVVDAFSYGKISGCLGYFLTHFHSDHYHGLNEGWCHGPIYCSQITANLVAQQLKVRDIYLHVLPMNEPTFVSSNIKVTLIDANHCPGSVLFIFDIQRKLEEADVDNNIWVRHLHTGDFRANPQMCLHPLLRQPENPPIDHLYLDTTYLNAKYGFPAQEECIQAACKVIEGYMGIKDETRPKTSLEQWIAKGTTTSDTKTSSSTSSLSSLSSITTATTNNNQQVTKPSAFDEMMSKAKVQRRIQGLLVVVGSYSIGKEKVFYSIAKLLGSKIFVTSKKWAILMCQENKELANLLTLDQMEAQVHVLPLGDIKAENMHAYLKSLSPRFTNIVAFKPTGWTFQASKAQETDMEIGSLSQVTKAPMDRDLTLTPRHSSPSIKIYGVPYSEHSSFRELASFIASLDIKHVIPTVNNESENARKRMMMYLDKWQNEKQGKTIEIVPYPAVTHW